MPDPGGERSFYRLAVDVAQQAKDLGWFLAAPTTHRAWKTEIEPLMPAHLTAARTAWLESRRYAHRASEYPAKTASGEYPNNLPAADSRNDQLMYAEREARLAKEEAEEEERRWREGLSHEWGAEFDRLTAAWVESRRQALCLDLNEFGLRFEGNRELVEAVSDPPPTVMDRVSGASACEVLLKIGNEMTALLHHKDFGPMKVKWDSLIDAVRREAARVTHQLSRGRASSEAAPTYASAEVAPSRAAPDTEEVDPAPRAKFELARAGSGWRLRFKGVESYLPDLVGFTYLFRLLSSPGRPWKPQDLRGDMDAVCTSPQPILDPEAIKQVKHRAESIEAALVEEGSPLSAETREELEAELVSCRHQLRIAKGRRRPRELPDDHSRARSNVGMNLSKALKQVEAADPAAHEHFQAHIKTPFGQHPCYDPPEPPTWSLSSRE